MFIYSLSVSTTPPRLEVVAVDPVTFNFTLTPQSAASQCARHNLLYNITPSTSDGRTLPNITLAISDPREPTTITSSGFDTCGSVYRFNTVAVSNVLVREQQAFTVADPAEVNFFGNRMLHLIIQYF